MSKIRAHLHSPNRATGMPSARSHRVRSVGIGMGDLRSPAPENSSGIYTVERSMRNSIRDRRLTLGRWVSVFPPKADSVFSVQRSVLVRPPEAGKPRVDSCLRTRGFPSGFVKPRSYEKYLTTINQGTKGKSKKRLIHSLLRVLRGEFSMFIF